MKKIFFPLLGGFCALSIFFNVRLMDKKELLEADLKQTYFELNGAQDALDSLYVVNDSLEYRAEYLQEIMDSAEKAQAFERVYKFACKSSDLIRNEMDHGNTSIVKTMRDVSPELEGQLKYYGWWY